MGLGAAISYVPNIVTDIFTTTAGQNTFTATNSTIQVLSTSTIVTPTKTGYVISQSSSTQFNAAIFDVICVGW